jgi:uncharacterized iron-regulated membrane protein
MKVFFRRIHLYLGLAAGLIITISSLTGALLVFEKELTEAFNHDRYYVQPAGARLSLDKLAAMVKEQVPGAGIARIQVFADPERTAQVLLDEGKKAKKESGNDKAAKKGKPGAPPKKEKGRTAFVDPYTGKVVELYSYQQTFYYKIFSLHRWLLAGDTGKVITGISTLIFLFILITGIVLWWPKTRAIFKQRVKMKWGSGWKRFNHDMHVVFGFYASIFLFIVAFTGLTWSFDWFSNAFYSLLGGTPKQAVAPLSAPAAVAANSGKISCESALAIVQQQAPGAVFYAVSAPKDSTAAFTVSLLPQGALHDNATTTYYLDQFKGKMIQSQTFAQRSLAQQVKASVKPVHTGAIFGTASKVFALIIALLGATFPATGTIMWINRTRKKKKKVKSPAMPVEVRQVAPVGN